MGTMWPRSGSLEFNSSGVPAEGALAYFYESESSTPLAVYQDGDEATPHESPVEADGNGRWPAVFVPYGTYKFVLKTAGGTTLFTADKIPNPEPFDDTFELDETAQYNTGDYIFVGKNGTRTGAVRCNGRTIGDASSNGTERANADCADLFAYLWDNYLNAEAAIYTSGGVASTRGATAAADFAAHKAIALPDHRGAHLVGFDDMGNTAASLMGSAPVVVGSAILAGSILGANTHVLTSGQLAAHTHAISFTSGAEAAHTHALSSGSVSTNNTGAHTHAQDTVSSETSHTHTYQTATTKTATATGFGTLTGSIWAGADTNATSGAGSSHTHTFTTTSDGNHTHTVSGTSDAGSSHTHAISGTSASSGSDTAHNNVARSTPVTILMKL